MKAILFKTDGSQEEVKPIKGRQFSLAEMYELIKCTTVERAVGRMGDTVGEIWCDEEGLLKANWKINEAATKLYRAAHPDVDPSELAIVGNALFIVQF